MKEVDRRSRNYERIKGLYPPFARQVRRVLTTMENKGWRARIQDGWRSAADQEAAYRRGTSKVRFGFHNVTAADGTPEALAVDILDDENPLNPPREYLYALARAAWDEGLDTGITWGLPLAMAGRLRATILDGATDSPAGNARLFLQTAKIGWDPTHVQPTGITIAQAKAGLRII